MNAYYRSGVVGSSRDTEKGAWFLPSESSQFMRRDTSTVKMFIESKMDLCATTT